MGPSVYLFNLPPVETCTPTDWCLTGNNGKPVCYALKGNFMFESARRSAIERLEASKQDDFVEKMCAEIKKAKPKYFRFHSSGDFYSEEYVQKVREIASSAPYTMFRTTTRRRDLAGSLVELNKLPNFIVRESLDTCRTIPEMGLPFAALDFLDVVKTEKSYKCRNDCVACDYTCWKSPGNMHFGQH